MGNTSRKLVTACASRVPTIPKQLIMDWKNADATVAIIEHYKIRKMLRALVR